jgi:hypothetical protein
MRKARDAGREAAAGEVSSLLMPVVVVAAGSLLFVLERVQYTRRRRHGGGHHVRCGDTASRRTRVAARCGERAADAARTCQA